MPILTLTVERVNVDHVLEDAAVADVIPATPQRHSILEMNVPIVLPMTAAAEHHTGKIGNTGVMTLWCPPFAAVFAGKLTFQPQLIFRLVHQIILRSTHLTMFRSSPGRSRCHQA